MTSTIQFIKGMYGESVDGFISFFNMQTRRTLFYSCEEFSELEEALARESPDHDIYIALGTQSERLAPNKRGAAASVRAVPGFFADIDFADQKKSKKQYPKDENEALTILSSFPVPPTAVVTTGNGVHAHWHFETPIVASDERELAQLKKASARFQQNVRAHFRNHGREIDSVGDLARNFRPPGTFNHKSSPPKLVQLASYEPERCYTLATLEAVSFESPKKSTRIDPSAGEASHDLIVQGCAWYCVVVVEGAPTCDEPNWYAGASITARCAGGEKIFQTYSRRHPDYNEREATEKFRRALTEAGPRTCAAIENDLGHAGCRDCPHHEKIKSPIQLGMPYGRYVPGKVGPIPLGYSGSEFILRIQETKEVVRRSSMQLSSVPILLELAPASFWEEISPKMGQKGPYGIDAIRACDLLIQANRKVGVLDIENIRGIGVWRDGPGLVVNLGGEELKSQSSFIYTTPKRIILVRADVPIETILEFLSMPNWTTPKAPELLLGWGLAGVICGALSWRPHVGVTGAAQAGKSTVLRGMGRILSPLAIIREGTSTEAGIRQVIGHDARPVILDELEPESARDRGRVERIVKMMRSSSGAEGSVARGTPEGKALSFSTRGMFLVGAINLLRISAADTSRLVKLEVARHDADGQRRGSAAIQGLLRKLEGVGPAFCQMAIDNAEHILASIPVLHDELPVVQERQADNMATLLAGCWVAQNRRAITASEVAAFVEPFVEAVNEQKEGVELDDATECLNVLLGTSVFITLEDTNDQGNTFTHKETKPLGNIISEVVRDRITMGYMVEVMNQHGIRAEFEDGAGFVVANSHPGLDKVFRNTRWESRLWGSALPRLPGAFRTPQRRFSDGVRSLATFIPANLLPEVPDAEY